MEKSDAEKLQSRLLLLVSCVETTTTKLNSQLDDALFYVNDVEKVIKAIMAIKDEVQELEKVALQAKSYAYPERERLMLDATAVHANDTKLGSYVSTPEDYGLDYDNDYMYADPNRETRTSVWNIV